MQMFSGREYLQIDIASNWGLDKKTWDERIAWFNANEDKLEQLVKDAETPALFYAGVQAWKAVKRGEPIGYPVSFDATSSGLQFLAALAGDRRAAELCNVVNQGDKRSDAYTLIYEAMLLELGGVSNIRRDDAKEAVMTALYGSKAVPKRVFGEGQQLRVFYKVMERLAPAAWDLNELFLEVWDPQALSNDWVLPDNFHVHIKVMSTTVDTVHLFNEPIELTRKVNAPKEKGRSLGANVIHSLDGMVVREITRRCDYDPQRIFDIREILEEQPSTFIFSNWKVKGEAHRMTGILWDHYEKSGYLSARILDYIDTDTIEMVDKHIIGELIDTLPVKPFKVVSTHDCFRSLPNYMNDVRKQYNLQLYFIAQSDLLNYILGQITNGEMQIGKLDETLPHDILEANYALS